MALRAKFGNNVGQAHDQYSTRKSSAEAPIVCDTMCAVIINVFEIGISLLKVVSEVVRLLEEVVLRLQPCVSPWVSIFLLGGSTGVPRQCLGAPDLQEQGNSGPGKDEPDARYAIAGHIGSDSLTRSASTFDLGARMLTSEL